MTETIDWQGKAFDAGRVFTPTSPINAQELFAGREEQLRQISDVIAQLGQHAILYGERGVGKTSLANVFASFLGRQNVLAPRINCDATDTFDSVWRKALEQVRLTKNVPAPGFTSQPKTIPIDPGHLLGEVASPDTVRKCLTTLSQHFVPVFVIDEFDRLGSDVRRTFADTIKSLSDYAVPATILLVGVADSVDELIAEHQSIQRALAQVRMPRMSQRELEALLDNGIKKLSMSIQSAAKRRVIKLSQGLPHYAHLLALNAVRAALDAHSLEVAGEHVKGALGRALTSTQQSVLSAYERAIRSARKDNLFSKVLLACAMSDTNELGEFAPQDIRPYLEKIAGKWLDIPSFAQHLKEFTEPKRGPVLHKSGIPRLYRYKFIDPLLQPYVIMQGVEAELIKMTDLE